MKTIKIPKWKGTTTTILTKAQETGHVILVDNNDTRTYLFKLAKTNNITDIRIITAEELVNIWSKVGEKCTWDTVLVHEYNKVLEKIIELISGFKTDLMTIVEN